MASFATHAASTWSHRLRALPRETRDTLFLLLVVAWLVAPQAQRLPLWCTLGVGAVLLWRAALAVSGRPLPHGLVLAGLLAAGVAATWLTYRSVLGRDAGVTLTVLLLALKTLEMRARRDAFVIFFLGFFTMLTNFFFSQSLLVAGAMLVGLLGLLTALINAHLPAGRPSLWLAARTAAWMALAGAPIMAALFVLFPRVAPLWGLPSDAMSGRSGLSPTMQVGSLAQLALDESIALRVRFEGRAPSQSLLYFRGPVLSSFDGREWRELGDRPPGWSSGQRLSAQLATQGPPLRYAITLEPHQRNWLLALDATASPPRIGAPHEVSMRHDLQWTSSRPVSDLLRYEAELHLDFRHGPPQRTLPMQAFVDLPAGFNPRTRDWAARMRADPRLAGADASTLADAVMEHLRNGGFAYTLEPGVFGTHTADEFWFERKEGFCEHIASSFVILMRALDVPARVVTGYQGGTLNNVDGYWTVRQSDAHAWTEIWQADRGWMRVDPTSAVAPYRVGSVQRLRPPVTAVGAVLGAAVPADLLRSMRALWEATNNAWNQWILNYTQSKQLDLFKNLGFSTAGWEDMGLMLIALVVAASALGALWTLWERQRRRNPWVALLDRLRERLRASGMDATDSSAPRQLAQRLQAQHPGAAADQIAAWLLRYEQARYGSSGEATAPDLRQLRDELKRLPWNALRP